MTKNTQGSEWEMKITPRRKIGKITGITKRSWFYKNYPLIMSIVLSIPLTIVIILLKNL